MAIRNIGVNSVSRRATVASKREECHTCMGISERKQLGRSHILRLWLVPRQRQKCTVVSNLGVATFDARGSCLIRGKGLAVE